MRSFTLAQIAELIHAKVYGDTNCQVNNIAPIKIAKAGDLTFADGQYIKYLSATTATAVILVSKHVNACKVPALVVDNPKLALAQVIPLFFPPSDILAEIHPSAVIDDTCQIENNVSIGAHCVIERGVTIGENTIIGANSVIGAHARIGSHCHLYANTTLYQHVILKNRVVVHSGVVIGADGFGYAHTQKQWTKVPQVGTVIVENDVEIGANSSIDRGTLSDTVIGEGVKIDNQVQIGHNVTIGQHTIIAGCTGIAGSTDIGAYCIIGGGACIGDHLQITDGVIIGGMGAVGQSVTEPGIYSSGIGILKNNEWRRNMLRFAQLDQMAKRIRKLENKADATDGY